MAASRTIVVAGAGIGGLTASIALAECGFRVIVLERAEKPENRGAGLQLSPNASRVLLDLGMEKHLAPYVVSPDGIAVMTARTGKEVSRIPLGDKAIEKFGAPYWVIRRADLQLALLARAQENPDIDVRFGCQFEDVATYPKGMTVVQRKDITRVQEPALALIGADGVWSNVRNQIFPKNNPQFTGRIAWRGTVEATQLPREFNARRVQLWMGANGHIVAYPMIEGRSINVVAVVRGQWNRPGWSEPGDMTEIRNHFSAPQWPIAPRMLVGAVGSWRKWALFAMKEPAWCNESMALIGDAAHAMLPFAAQGAAMAIEDAAVIAKSLHDNSGNVPAAFRHYARQRAHRIARVQRIAQQNGGIYHLGGPVAFMRDQAMRVVGGSALLARQNWIYKWRVD